MPLVLTATTGSFWPGGMDAGFTTLMVLRIYILVIKHRQNHNAYKQSSESGRTSLNMESVIKLIVSGGIPLGRGSRMACWGHEGPNWVASCVPLVYLIGTGRRNRKSPVLSVKCFSSSSRNMRWTHGGSAKGIPRKLEMAPEVDPRKVAPSRVTVDESRAVVVVWTRKRQEARSGIHRRAMSMASELTASARAFYMP